MDSGQVRPDGIAPTRFTCPHCGQSTPSGYTVDVWEARLRNPPVIERCLYCNEDFALSEEDRQGILKAIESLT